LQHARQECTDGPVHCSGVEVEREGPCRLVAVENSAGKDDAGAVEQDIDWAQLFGQRVDRLSVANVEPSALASDEIGQKIRIDVGG